MSRSTEVSRTVAVGVSFAALHMDPYPRNATTGHYLDGPTADPSGWGPTLRALGHPRSDLRGRVGTWYCLCHPAVLEKRKVGRTAVEVAKDTEIALREQLRPEHRPRFERRELRTRRPPTDHGDLYRLVCDELRWIRARHADAELVLVLSAGTPQMHAALFLAGSVGIVEGPISLVQIEKEEHVAASTQKPVVGVTLTLQTVLQVARGTVPATALAEDAPSGGYEQARSPALLNAIDQARHAAKVPFPVLLRGERGVGKSRLATWIRAWSGYRKPRHDREWPAVACGQFPDAQRLLIELCGSVRGGFTGAENREGLLSLAHEETLFLDEIHDLSDQCQRVIIRLLEDGTYYPVGSARPKVSRFRLITGTNQPDSVLRSRLSADFYDRIRDIEIVVPALRDCREDLGWMWIEQWRQVAGRARVDAAALDHHADRIAAGLGGDALPGNWRDLRRLAVRFALALHADETLTVRRVNATIQEVLASTENAGDEGADHLTTPAGLTKREARRLSQLENILGPGLDRFWAAASGAKGPRLVLEELLGDRDRARRAATFIAATFHDRWLAIGRRRGTGAR